MPGLKQSKLFNPLTPEELQFLEAAAVERKFGPKETVFQEGDKGDGLYVVTQGEIQISALINDNDRRVLSRIGPGDYFGEMAVLDSEPRSATAIAHHPATVAFIPREKVLELLERSPRLALSLVRDFSQRMRDFNRHYVQEVIQAERLAVVGRFARSIVHDFKNPLNIIGLAAELMEMEGAPPALRQSASGRIRKQVDRLTNMSNELLEFTRAPGQNTVLSPVDYHQFLTELIQDIQADIKEKAVEIQLRNEPPRVPLLMDSKRLVHVFSNLVHNAVDAMPQGGRIMFSFETHPKEVLTTVEDTGSGIAPEILPRLFEAFATHGKAKGTGLGLSICRKIIEDHRGRIEAKSEPGRGGIFTFSLLVAGA